MLVEGWVEEELVEGCDLSLQKGLLAFQFGDFFLEELDVLGLGLRRERKALI